MLKLEYSIAFILSSIVYVGQAKTMNIPQKLETAGISTIHRGENNKEIYYKADLVSFNGPTAITAVKWKRDTKYGQAGSIICWKECRDDVEEIDSTYFVFLEKEYVRRKKIN